MRPNLSLLAALALQLAGGCCALSADSAVVQAAQPGQEVLEVNGTATKAAVLPCRVPEAMAEHPEFKVIWMRGKATLTLRNRHLADKRMSIKPTSVLEPNHYDLRINDLMRSDAGLYRCVASCPNEDYFIRNIRLEVFVPTTINKKESSDSFTTLVEGSSHTLRCVADGYPQPTVQWFKTTSRRLGAGDQRVYLGEGEQYHISNVTRECDGTFVCNATNGVEEAAVEEFELTVKYRPRVTTRNDEIFQRRGGSTMVMCVISGNPLSSFYWVRNGVKLRAGSRQSCQPPGPLQKYCLHLDRVENRKHVVELNLMVNNLTAADFGAYYCVAESEYGNVSMATNVVESQRLRPRRASVAAPRMYSHPAAEIVASTRGPMATPVPTAPGQHRSQSDSPADGGESSSRYAPGSLTSDSFRPNSARALAATLAWLSLAPLLALQ